EDPVTDAKAPGLLVVRRAIRNPVRTRGKAEQMRLQRVQRHHLVHRGAVIDDVQVRVREIDDLFAVHTLDPRIADVPLSRDRPVENACSGRHLVQGEWNLALEPGERLADAVAGDAAADRKQVRRQAVHLGADHDGHVRGGSKSGYWRSRSEITRISSGQETRNSGSFQRTPRAASGA